MDYDPKLITFEELLILFWESHTPTYPPFSKQYMSAIFYHDLQQKELAEKIMEKMSVEWNKQVWTKLLPYTEFTLAEDYHQKYYLRKLQGVKKILNIKSDLELVNSPIATKLNGYLHGHGNFAEFPEYLNQFPEISVPNREFLLSLLAQYHQVPLKKGRKCKT